MATQLKNQVLPWFWGNQFLRKFCVQIQFRLLPFLFFHFLCKFEPPKQEDNKNSRFSIAPKSLYKTIRSLQFLGVSKHSQDFWFLE